jgi:CheY-like chemotaxis protein
LKARILVVEDDQIIQLDVCRHLAELHYQVVGSATSGEEAIKKAVQLQPDLILMDVRLRGALDGIEAARQIRSTLDVAVVYLTAQGGDERTDSSDKVLQPRIAKPFTRRTLRDGIEQALNGR